jgi:hypothetical protein
VSDNHIDDHLGPVEYLAIEFPDGKVTGEGFRHLLEAVDAGTVLVLDLELARREDQGWRKVAPRSLAADGVDLSVFEGADSSLLDDDDLELLGAEVSPDSVLAVLVYENLALNPALHAWGKHGARLVAEGPLSVDDLESVLPDTESHL